jgi:hypothetical protein
MPSKKDPNQIKVTSGLSGRGSNMFFPSTIINIGGSQFPEAYQVKSNPPPNMDGTNVQANLDEFHGLIPKRPNYLHETHSSAINPLNPVQVEMDHVLRFYNDGSDDFDVSPVLLIPSMSESLLLAPLYPADRGILALELGGVLTKAVNLFDIFYEGNVTFENPDGRYSRHRNYVQDSSDLYYEGLVYNSAGQVSGLDQISLVLRFPYKDSYDEFNGVDGGALIPVVYPDSYPNTFHSYQICAALPIVELPIADTAYEVRLIHFKTIEDFDLYQASQVFESFGILDLAEGLNEGWGQIPLMYDSQNTVDLVSSSFVPPNTTSAPSGVSLSGVRYYGPTDVMVWSFQSEGMFNASFLEEGSFLSLESNGSAYLDEPVAQLAEYSLNGTRPSDIAELNKAAQVQTYLQTPSCLKVDNATTTVSNGSGDMDSHQHIFTAPLMIVSDPATTTIPTPSSLKSKTENFTSEVSRYPSSVSLSSSVLPDGSTSSWNSSSNLGPDDLQVGHVTTDNFSLALGGALFLPHHNYTSHRPSAGQPDYSTYPVSNTDRSYVRSFDVEGIRRVGKFRIISDSSNLFDLFKHDDSALYGGHSQGLEILVAPSGIPSQEWLDLGRLKGDGNGALIRVEEISMYEVEVSYELDNFPVLQNGFYPVAMKITVYDQSPVFNDSNFSIRHISWLK